ncbi:MAG: hypothetical protein K2O88_07445 [Paramuribaculum sp.]|nr:hypothetical protein [Paramuribaculum sp.]
MRYYIIETQISVTMCKVKNIRHFVKNGVRTFALAARGEYNVASPRIEVLADELKQSLSGPAADKLRLRQDRARISKDVSAAFQKYKQNLSHE